VLNITHWEAVHWTILTAFLTGVGSQLAALPSWHDAMTPLFLGGVLVQFGSLLVAIKSRPPVAPLVLRRPDPEDDV